MGFLRKFTLGDYKDGMHFVVDKSKMAGGIVHSIKKKGQEYGNGTFIHWDISIEIKGDEDGYGAGVFLWKRIWQSGHIEEFNINF